MVQKVAKDRHSCILNIRVTEEVGFALERAMERRGESMSALCRNVLRYWLELHGYIKIKDGKHG